MPGISKMNTLAQISIDTKASVEATINGIDLFNLSPGLTQYIRASDGGIDPTYSSINEQKPQLDFTSTALKTILDICGLGGLYFEPDTGDPGITAFFQAMAEGGVRKTGSNHTSITMANGFMVPVVLSGQQGGGPAKLSCTIHVTYDGTNNPIVFANDAALIGSGGTGAAWTVGGVSINGNALDSVLGITVNFGIQVLTRSSDGGIWSTFSTIMSRAPSIEIQTNDVEFLATLGCTGLAQDVNDSVIYFRKMTKGGGRVIDATAEHIKITVDEGRIMWGPVSGGQGAEQAYSIIITPTHDLTAAILVINTASAIT